LQREALVLAEYEDLSLAEIAQATDCEVGTVKSRLHRAKENLRRMLAPLKEETKEGSTYGTAK
jgi:RNA polymerase sigma-70 factor (ECF subfamily)